MTSLPTLARGEPKKALLLIGLILIFACGGQPAGPAAAPTRTRLPTFTLTPSPTQVTAAVMLEPTPAPVATATFPAATVTLAPTFTPLPLIFLSQHLYPPSRFQPGLTRGLEVD